MLNTCNCLFTNIYIKTYRYVTYMSAMGQWHKIFHSIYACISKLFWPMKYLISFEIFQSNNILTAVKLVRAIFAVWVTVTDPLSLQTFAVAAANLLRFTC